MASFLALLAFLQTAGVHVERVHVPGPDGIALDAALVLPAGPASAPAIVAFHGCGGPFPTRDGQWAVALAKAGHIVLLPDSFGSRTLGSQCTNTARTVTAGVVRRRDAIAAASWLAARPGTPSGGVALIGWSDGGSTVLAAARVAADLPRGLLLRAAAFYPGCRPLANAATWTPAIPVLIAMGENDDWTPAQPCHELARRYPSEIASVFYPGAYHDFDAPNSSLRLRPGLTAGGIGNVHVGTDPTARQDALARVPHWLETGQLEAR